MHLLSKLSPDISKRIALSVKLLNIYDDGSWNVIISAKGGLLWDLISSVV